MMDIKIHVPIVTSEKTTSTSEEVVFVPNKSNIIRMRLEDGLCRGRLTGHFKSVTGLAFSPMHLELFSGSSDRAILVWDAQNLGDFEENLAEKNVKEPDRITVDAWTSSSSSEDGGVWEAHAQTEGSAVLSGWHAEEGMHRERSEPCPCRVPGCGKQPCCSCRIGLEGGQEGDVAVTDEGGCEMPLCLGGGALQVVQYY